MIGGTVEYVWCSGDLGPYSFMLRDGAQLVPIHPPYSAAAHVHYWRGERTWVTLCHCGPAAPFPSPVPVVAGPCQCECHKCCVPADQPCDRCEDSHGG